MKRNMQNEERIKGKREGVNEGRKGKCVAMLLCTRDFPGKNTGAGCISSSRGFFSTQGSEPASLASSALASGFFTTHTTCETPKCVDMKSSHSPRRFLGLRAGFSKSKALGEQNKY